MSGAICGLQMGYESRMSRSLSSGAHSRDPLAHPGYPPLTHPAPSPPTPDPRNAGQDDAQQDNDQGNLEPDEAADLPEHEFDSRAPWRGNAVADGFHAVLD